MRVRGTLKLEDVFVCNVCGARQMGTSITVTVDTTADCIKDELAAHMAQYHRGTNMPYEWRSTYAPKCDVFTCPTCQSK